MSNNSFRFDAPNVGIFSNPTVCLTLNHEWVSLISGMCRIGESESYWNGDAYAASQQVSEFLNALDLGNCPETEPVRRIKFNQAIHTFGANLTMTSTTTIELWQQPAWNLSLTEQPLSGGLVSGSFGVQNTSSGARALEFYATWNSEIPIEAVWKETIPASSFAQVAFINLIPDDILLPATLKFWYRAPNGNIVVPATANQFILSAQYEYLD